MSYLTQSPVILCVFNRPNTTQRVFEAIRAVRPPALYIIADAPRLNKSGEAQLCQQTRQIVEQIDWPCEHTLDYATKNLGCQQRMYTGITNAFKRYDFAIILEDDCLPSSDFFRFVDTVRERYEHDKQVMHISGTAFVRPKYPEFAYYRSNIPVIWGWATWRENWKGMDLSMQHWPQLKEQLVANAPANSQSLTRLIRRIDNTYKGKVNSWAYPHLIHIIRQNGHSISPTYNLIKNIGFGKTSTTTTNAHWPQAQLPLDKLPLKISQPDTDSIHHAYTNLQLINSIYRPRKFHRLIHKICRAIHIPYKAKLKRPVRNRLDDTAPYINLPTQLEQ